MTNKKFYTGIGSRQTPPNVCLLMTKLALVLYKFNYILRSGHAEGADMAFENGASEKADIYLPWKLFNNSNSNLYVITPKSLDIAKQIHPAWNKCSQYAKLLHARNVYQILGNDVKTLSDFVICWTPNAKIVGGTATAINLAKQHNIPVFNLADVHIQNKILEYVECF